jgi:hypothetical protein
VVSRYLEVPPLANRREPPASARRPLARAFARLLGRWRPRRKVIRVSRLSDDWLRRHDAEATKHPPL